MSNHAILGDMDGTYQQNHDTATQNHEEGHNILYVDGHVKWQTTNYVSNDLNDNIFTEAGSTAGDIRADHTAWHADTDSFLSDNTDALDPDLADENQYDDLTGSYDTFNDLRPLD